MADQRSAGAVSEHSIKSSSHVESEHRIRASKKQGQIVKMHLLFWHIEGVSYKLEVLLVAIGHNLYKYQKKR